MWSVDGPCEVGSLVAWVVASVAGPNPSNLRPRDLVLVLVLVLAASEVGWVVETVAVEDLGEVATVVASVADAVALEAEEEALGTEGASAIVVDSEIEVEGSAPLTEATVTEEDSVVEEVEVDSEADVTTLVDREVAEVSGMHLDS